jgi:hypothetical protein
MLRAVATQKAPVLLAASAATGMNVTGTTNETALATVTIPAGAMGANGAVMIQTSWSYTNSANTKTLRIRLGGASGSVHFAFPATTTATFSDLRRIRNRNSASSQVCSQATVAQGIGSSGAAIATSAVDTSVAVDLVISGQLALGTETITLESYEVWLLPE